MTSTHTATATLRVGLDCKPIIAHWQPWRPSCELRRFGRDRRLQQRWYRDGLSNLGFVADVQDEWRDIEYVAR